jgi:hypothetical protein
MTTNDRVNKLHEMIPQKQETTLKETTSVETKQSL